MERGCMEEGIGYPWKVHVDLFWAFFQLLSLKSLFWRISYIGNSGRRDDTFDLRVTRWSAIWNAVQTMLFRVTCSNSKGFWKRGSWIHFMSCFWDGQNSNFICAFLFPSPPPPSWLTVKWNVMNKGMIVVPFSQLHGNHYTSGTLNRFQRLPIDG